MRRSPSCPPQYTVQYTMQCSSTLHRGAQIQGGEAGPRIRRGGVNIGDLQVDRYSTQYIQYLVQYTLRYTIQYTVPYTGDPGFGGGALMR